LSALKEIGHDEPYGHNAIEYLSVALYLKRLRVLHEAIATLSLIRVSIVIQSFYNARGSVKIAKPF
jgi:hypothetical protein